MLDARNAIIPQHRIVADDAIREAFLASPEYRAAETVMFYASFGNEVSTWELIRHALASGKTAALPFIGDTPGEMTARWFSSIEHLSAGCYGIMQPVPETTRELDAASIDLIVVPGLAFDREGRRLGFGGGYYDRYLNLMRSGAYAIALAYDAQIVDRVPSDCHDMRVPVVITDRERIDCVSCDSP